MAQLVLVLLFKAHVDLGGQILEKWVSVLDGPSVASDESPMAPTALMLSILVVSGIQLPGPEFC